MLFKVIVGNYIKLESGLIDKGRMKMLNRHEELYWMFALLRWCTPCVIVVMLVGCLAGGISVRHDPHENAVLDQQYVIRLSLGAPGGNAAKGFKSAQFIMDGTTYPMERENESVERVVFVYKGPYSAFRHKRLDYRFTYLAESGTYTYQPKLSSEVVR